MSQRRRFDLIVIGAGPAGSAAALVAAQGGLSVALVDRAAFPRDKLCGGGISGRAQGHLDRVFGALPDGLMHPVSQIRLRHRGAELGMQTCDPPFRTTMRRAFDAVLVGRALGAGAADHTGQRVRGIDPDAAAITLTCGMRLQAPLLIGADGVNSSVARRLWGRAHDPARVAFALEVEAPAQDGPEVLEIDLGAAHWGYGWSFPKAGGLTLGVGGLAARNPALGASMADYLARSGAPKGLRIRGHHLPFGDFPAIAGQGRVLLAGDAAGLVDPITGEGIGWAVHSGALAGAAAVRALAEDAPGAALRHYMAGLAPVHAELRRARALRRLIYARPLQGRFARAIARNPAIQRRYVQLLQGERDYADLGAGSVLRLLRRLVLPALDPLGPRR